MKILLVDDHSLLRHGCSCLLAQQIPGVGILQAEDGEQALLLVQRQIPDLVLMDIGLPGISGLETTRRLRSRLPQLRVLFYSQHEELSIVRQALDAGAAGYVSKRASAEVLLEAVRKVLSGFLYIEQHLATQLACRQPGRSQDDPRLAGMTQREFEVFVMLARGLSPRRIAEKLCISSKTVSNYQTLLKNKLQVDSLTELVHLALGAGVLAGLPEARLGVDRHALAIS